MSILLSDSVASHEKLKVFLQRWPMAVVEGMSLNEYTMPGNRDTFTYWLEFGSQELGRIGGGGTYSSMFGIWKLGSITDKKSRDYYTDGIYKWHKELGGSADIAFEKVRKRILEIISFASSGDLKSIDNVKLHSFVRWKVAFVYSNYTILPIYNSQILRAVACYFDHDHFHQAPFSELQSYILKLKLQNDDFFDFSTRCFKIGQSIVKKESKRNYYIIGSKYGSNVDVLPEMVARGVVSVGFLWGYDFTPLVGMGLVAFNKYAKKYIPKDIADRHAAIKTMRKFINLKAGDVIAIKSVGSFNRLNIVGYAMVKEIDGLIYKPNDENLGHLINVDMMESGLNIQTNLNYAETIHQIIPGDRPGHFEAIFGSYSYLESDISDFEGRKGVIDKPFPEEDDNNDIREKDDSERWYEVSAKHQLVTHLHNTLQNAFARYLDMEFPQDQIVTERNRIDIWRKNSTDFYIYEIKPYNSAYACIRAGLGQLMDYAFSITPSLNTTLVIVGPVKPNETSLKYMKFISNHLRFTFTYIHYDLKVDTATTYNNYSTLPV
jgi:hypothetical protein